MAAPQHKQPPGLQQGIYFNLLEDAYHEDFALSHSGMVKILESPSDFWYTSTLNPKRKEFRATPAMKEGKLCHMMLLEPEKFFSKYCQVGSTSYRRGKQSITSTDWNKIKESVDAVNSESELAGYFKDGYPEVCIVLVDEETGIRYRVLIDYLRTFGGIDYKRIKSIKGFGLGGIINESGFDIQQRLYQDAIVKAKRLLRIGKLKVFGKVDPAWLKAFMEDKRTDFTFVFQRSSWPFPITVQQLDDEILAQGDEGCRLAFRAYKYFIERYGRNPWPRATILKEKFSIYQMPKRYYDRGALYTQ